MAGHWTGERRECSGTSQAKDEECSKKRKKVFEEQCSLKMFFGDVRRTSDCSVVPRLFCRDVLVLERMVKVTKTKSVRTKAENTIEAHHIGTQRSKTFGLDTYATVFFKVSAFTNLSYSSCHGTEEKLRRNTCLPLQVGADTTKRATNVMVTTSTSGHDRSHGNAYTQDTKRKATSLEGRTARHNPPQDAGIFTIGAPIQEDAERSEEGHRTSIAASGGEVALGRRGKVYEEGAFLEGRKASDLRVQGGDRDEGARPPGADSPCPQNKG